MDEDHLLLMQINFLISFTISVLSWTILIAEIGSYNL